jgi:hypothetical protein
MTTFDYVRILDGFGADTVNIGSTAYTRQADNCFYLAKEHADSLLSHPGSGAYLAPLDYASPTSSPEGLVISLIRGMAPGEVKRALLGALTALSLKALRQCPA